MLSLSSPPRAFDGVLVFADHASPTTFHYLSGPPRLSLDETGKPQLSMLTYRHALETVDASAEGLDRDQLGGGFLMLGVDCRIDGDQLRRIRSELQATLPPGSEPVSLVPVFYTAGKVSLLALDKESPPAVEEGEAPRAQPDTPESRFVRGILGSASPSLFQDQRAIFSVSLSPDGVSLLEAAFASGLAPIGVVYELEFMGLRDALEVKVTADQRRIYERFRAGLDIAAGDPSSAMLDFEISATLEKLRQEGAIDVEIIRQQDGASVDQMEQRAMALLKETLLQDMFQPKATGRDIDPARALESAVDTARSLQGGSSSGGSAVTIGFELSYKHEDSLKTITYDYSARAPERRIHAPNGFVGALVEGLDPADHLLEVDLDSAFFQTLQVRGLTTVDFASIDLAAAKLMVQYGGDPDDPDEAEDILLTADAPEGTVEFWRDGRPLSYRHAVEYTFGDAAHIAAASSQVTTPWRTTNSRVQVVHPPADVPMLRVYVEPGVVAWDLVEQIEVLLRYDDEDNDFHVENRFLVEQESERQPWIVRTFAGGPRHYTVQLTWRLQSGNVIEGEPVVERAPQLFVPDPFRDRLRIVVEPQLDPARVLRASVVLHYEDDENDLRVTRLVELPGPDFRSQQVDIPVVDRERRSYSYEVSIVPADGRSPIQREPVETERSTVFVGDGAVRQKITVAMLGDLAAAGLSGVQVDVSATPPDGSDEAPIQSALFEPGGERSWSTTLEMSAEAPPIWRYRLTAFGAEAVEEGDWEDQEAPRLTLLASKVAAELLEDA